jgi:hypothetical protein
LWLIALALAWGLVVLVMLGACWAAARGDRGLAATPWTADASLLAGGDELAERLGA